LLSAAFLQSRPSVLQQLSPQRPRAPPSLTFTSTRSDNRRLVMGLRSYPSRPSSRRSAVSSSSSTGLAPLFMHWRCLPARPPSAQAIVRSLYIAQMCSINCATPTRGNQRELMPLCSHPAAMQRQASRVAHHTHPTALMLTHFCITIIQPHNLTHTHTHTHTHTPRRAQRFEGDSDEARRGSCTCMALTASTRRSC
jgi:hypothetical protein